MSQYLKEVLKHKKFLIERKDFIKVERIGKGNYGEVWKSKRKSDGKLVAMKILFISDLQDEDMIMFKREIDIFAEVSDRFLLPFIGFTVSLPLWIITDFVPNGNLFEALKKKPEGVKLNGENKTLIAIGVAHGMAKLHKKGIIHRDLKSMNVLLDANLYPVICDFGISRFMQEKGTEFLTSRLGTPHWMAPEQYDGDDYDGSCDVFAFAVLLWEMLAESPPYKGWKPKKVIDEVIYRGYRLEIPKDRCTSELADLVSRCWDSDPSNRPSFEEILRDFRSKKFSYKGTKEAAINEYFKMIDRWDAEHHENTSFLAFTKDKTSKERASVKSVGNNFQKNIFLSGRVKMLHPIEVPEYIAKQTKNHPLSLLFDSYLKILISDPTAISSLNLAPEVFKDLPKSVVYKFVQLITVILEIEVPSYIEAAIKEIKCHTPTNPNDVLSLFNKVISNPKTKHLGSSLFDIFKHLSTKNTIHTFLCIIYSSLKKWNLPKSDLLAKILAYFLESEFSEIIMDVYHILFQFQVKIPVDVIVMHLGKKDYFHHALVYLMTQSQTFHSHELIKAVVLLIKSSEISHLLLSQFAENERGFQIILNVTDPDWLSEAVEDDTLYLRILFSGATSNPYFLNTYLSKHEFIFERVMNALIRSLNKAVAPFCLAVFGILQSIFRNKSIIENPISNSVLELAIESAFKVQQMDVFGALFDLYSSTLQFCYVASVVKLISRINQLEDKTPLASLLRFLNVIVFKKKLKNTLMKEGIIDLVKSLEVSDEDLKKDQNYFLEHLTT